MANVDLGHFVAAGGDPVAFLTKFHDRIASFHLKDRTTPANGQKNLPWGTGDTPLAALLQMVKKNKWTMPATIELEYDVPRRVGRGEGSQGSASTTVRTRSRKGNRASRATFDPSVKRWIQGGLAHVLEACEHRVCVAVPGVGSCLGSTIGVLRSGGAGDGLVTSRAYQAQQSPSRTSVPTLSAQRSPTARDDSPFLRSRLRPITSKSSCRGSRPPSSRISSCVRVRRRARRSRSASQPSANRSR